MGMSYGWWMDKHTRHHANPNHEERDPDVSPDLLVWSQRQARKSKGIARFIGRRQAALFVPLLTLEGVNLRVSSVRALLKPGIRSRGIEATALIVHFAIYFTLLFTLLPPLHALAFIAIHQAIFGVYLGATFAPNHKGMPHVDRGGRPRLPPQAGPDVPERNRWPGAERGDGRPQPPGRAPPLPEHAVGQPHQGAPDRPRLLP